MRAFCSWEVAQKANKWSGANTTRWRNEEYDRLWRAADTEMDPTKRAAQFIRMNDLVVENVVVVPVLVRHATFAVANRLRGFDFSPFSGPLWRLHVFSKLGDSTDALETVFPAPHLVAGFNPAMPETARYVNIDPASRQVVNDQGRIGVRFDLSPDAVKKFLGR